MGVGLVGVALIVARHLGHDPCPKCVGRTDFKIMRPFGLGLDIERSLGPRRGTGGIEGFKRQGFQIGRGKQAAVKRVEGMPVVGRIGDPDARTDLEGLHVPMNIIQPQTEVHGPLLIGRELILDPELFPVPDNPPVGIEG